MACFLAVFIKAFLSTSAITCGDERLAPANGNISCTNGNNFESTCTYTCANGYGLSEISLITATCIDNGDDDADGVWSAEAPTCNGNCFHVHAQYILDYSSACYFLSSPTKTSINIFLIIPLIKKLLQVLVQLSAFV